MKKLKSTYVLFLFVIFITAVAIKDRNSSSTIVTGAVAPTLESEIVIGIDMAHNNNISENQLSNLTTLLDDMFSPGEDVKILDEEETFDDELVEEAALDQDDFVDSLGMELDPKEDVSQDLHEAEKVSAEAVEAALERVIKKMFYEKIDRILVEVIEKTVTREIERLKGFLLEDAADNKE